MLHLIPAVIWFVFIVSLDRVLVSTMFATGRRWGAFLMRLALAVTFGIIIAEPLTIRIFQTAIEQHIQDERTQQLDDLRSRLLACNSKESAIGTAPAPAGCEGYLLSFDATPLALEAELTARRSDEAALKATVDGDSTELACLTEMARKECAGTAGPGLTGERGYGPDCRDRNRDVESFRATHPIKQNTDRLAAVRAEVATLSSELSDTQANVEQTRDTLIAQRVNEAREHQGSIGLLERIRALHALAFTTLALFLGTWAVRLFLILADCLPVVVKFSGGNSEYDRVFRAQSTDAVQRHAQDLAILRDEGDTYRLKHKADLDVEMQEHRAGRGASAWGRGEQGGFTHAPHPSLGPAEQLGRQRAEDGRKGGHDREMKRSRPGAGPCVLHRLVGRRGSRTWRISEPLRTAVPAATGSTRARLRWYLPGRATSVHRPSRRRARTAVRLGRQGSCDMAGSTVDGDHTFDQHGGARARGPGVVRDLLD